MTLLAAIPEPCAAGLPTPYDMRRKHILRAARTCFARAGFHGASMGQICAEAAMSPGALYRYFPGKDAIIEAIAEEERAEAGQCLAALFGEGPLVDRIVAVAMDYLGKSLDPDTGGLMVEICSESIRNTAIGERFHAVEAEVRQSFRAVMEAARHKGEIGPDVDLDVALIMLFALADGLVMRLQLETGAELAAIEPYLRRMASALLAGSAAP